jgi:MOSC domain-containing protein YiiM
MGSMRVLAVCIGHPETLPGKKYKTGINKHPALVALPVGTEGLAGDAVCDRRYHGGPDQAIYVEGSISLDQWSEELGRPVLHGEFGENLVIDGLDNLTVAVGDRFTIGDVILEATAPRMPCATFAAKMADAHFVKRYRKAARPGFYCRVINAGQLEAGMDVGFHQHPGQRIAMTELMRDYGKTISGERLELYLSSPIHLKLRAALEIGKIKF